MPLKYKLADRIQARIDEKNRLLKEKEQLKNEISEKEENIKKQTQIITEKEQAIQVKDNRNAQLHQLFQGTALIFQKQHNYVDHLKEKLEKEQKEKGISEEKAKHLEEDIKNLENQKKELGEKIKELEKLEKESKEIKEKELAELKTKLDQEQKNHQEQLRKINVLWDKNAVNYDKIEFNGLYEMLKKESEGVVLTEHEAKALDISTAGIYYALGEASSKGLESYECKHYLTQYENKLINFKISSVDTTTTTTTNFPHMLDFFSVNGVLFLAYKSIRMLQEEIKKYEKLKREFATRPTLEELNDVEREKEKLENELNRVKAELKNQPKFPISLDQWNDDYSKRPTRQQLHSIQNELNRVNAELWKS